MLMHAHKRAPRRRRVRLSLCMTALGVVTFGVLLTKYLLIPFLVWVQAMIGGAP